MNHALNVLLNGSGEPIGLGAFALLGCSIFIRLSGQAKNGVSFNTTTGIPNLLKFPNSLAIVPDSILLQSWMEVYTD